ncbi:TIGR03118 family protein [Adhaeribacter arboris]|uniref:TIGR03118 family protein n=1 Tax=Adhaeribacter arboris TaxID=2072846 RepID=A0A2T2YDF3_9BACT|nr:TIGR03118 family protein [Adhaeribacter arboris]PSR53526.1 TIGR03118 family protein [Adhaeribacter arboris]
MKKVIQKISRTPLAGVVIFLLAFFLVISGCDRTLDELDSQVKKQGSGSDKQLAEEPEGLKDFALVNLVANTDGDEYKAKRVEPKLQNAWGIAFGATGVPWVNATNTGLSFIFNAEGEELRAPVDVPSPTKSTGGLPTGIVFNGTTDFKLPNDESARFIFCGLDGVISGWNQGGSVEVVDRSKEAGYKGAVYTGIAKAVAGGKNYLYVANFSINKIDIFNAAFKQGKTINFKDPKLPAGYAPFNIRNLGNKLYVTYAKVGKDGRSEKGKGKGYVSVYEPNGTFIKRFASGGTLNAPWGIARAPKGFFDDDPKYSYLKDAILIGNFGDGYINVYTTDGTYAGQLMDDDKKPISIDGLWEITFPPRTAAANVDLTRLYYAAGPDEETNGVFGYITRKKSDDIVAKR